MTPKQLDRMFYLFLLMAVFLVVEIVTFVVTR